GAAPFLREIGGRLDRRRIPFSGQKPGAPSLYSRTHARRVYFQHENVEAARLYLNDEDVEAARDAIAATYRALHGSLRPAVPLFTREIAPGLAFAESPPTRDSFGMHRCGVIAEGLVMAQQRGAVEPEARLTILRERLTDYGLELDRLERNPTSRYPYRLDVLPQEHAA